MSAAKAALTGVRTTLSKLLPDFDAVRTEAGIDLKASAEASRRSAEVHKKAAADALADGVDLIGFGLSGSPVMLMGFALLGPGVLPAVGIGLLPILWGLSRAGGAAVEKLLQAKDEADAQRYAAQAGREALSA